MNRKALAAAVTNKNDISNVAADRTTAAFMEIISGALNKR
jgi:nucleoid DNA-binding protein